MMFLHPTLLLPVLIGCSLASFISPQYVNSLGYNGYYPTNPGGQNADGSGGGNGASVQTPGTSGQIVKFVGPSGKVVITNCNICRLCCIGRNVTYEIENVPNIGPGSVDQTNGYPTAPLGSYVVTPDTPASTGPPTTPTISEGPISTSSTPYPPGTVPTQPGPFDTTPAPGAPNQPQWPYPYPYPYPPASNQYETAPPSPYPCIPYPPATTEGPASTTTTPRPPCIYPEPTTTIPIYPPIEDTTTTTPQAPWTIETSTPVTTTAPGAPGVTGDCCYIDLRSIQAIVSCAAVGTKPGCCKKTCSQSAQVERQIQINFQLLARYFGQIPSRISCSDAVKYGLVRSSEIAGVCTPEYTPYPISTEHPDQTTTEVVPTEGNGNTIVIPTNGPMDVYATTPSSSSVTIGASILSIVLATVLCL